MKNMKYISFAIGAIYLGSMSLLNNAYAHNHNDRGIRMLFQNMDLTDEQRKKSDQSCHPVSKKEER